MAALQKGGFDLVRVTGSHHVLQHPQIEGSRVVVAVHAGQTVPLGTMQSILRQAKVDREEFLSWL